VRVDEEVALRFLNARRKVVPCEYGNRADPSVDFGLELALYEGQPRRKDKDDTTHVQNNSSRFVTRQLPGLATENPLRSRVANFNTSRAFQPAEDRGRAKPWLVHQGWHPITIRQAARI